MVPRGRNIRSTNGAHPSGPRTSAGLSRRFAPRLEPPTRGFSIPVSDFLAFMSALLSLALALFEFEFFSLGDNRSGI